MLPCDVSSDEQIQSVFDKITKHWDGIDVIVQSVVYTPRLELSDPFVESSARDGFRVTHEISSCSFVALAKAGIPLKRGRHGGLLTCSFIGADRAIPHYNVMGLATARLEAGVRLLAQSLGPTGIRVNGISASPIRTHGVAAITDSKKLLDYNDLMAPHGRGVSIEEVGNVRALLCSGLASGITGESTYLGGGFNTVATDLKYQWPLIKDP